ncbi:MAG: DUF5060 domain-containing protein [Candidatus Fervidibacter sp.]|uniref:DUF5060 domain-containing protein n=1 Tax=Candidatus Fervidibacter sp. TaxID=3100871 RepID=UPI00404906BC
MWAVVGSALFLTFLTGTTVEWSFSQTGVLNSSVAGKPLLQNLSAVIVKPGWQGSYADQLNPESVKVAHESNGKKFWKGVFQGDGALVEFTQTATIESNELVLTYEFQPKTTSPTEVLMLRCHLPTEIAAGKGEWFAVSELGWSFSSGVFPAALPDPYHLFSRSGISWFMWVLPSGYALLFDLRESDVLFATLQDNRRFRVDSFELQLHLKHGEWKAEEKVTTKLRLTVMTAEEAKGWIDKMRNQVEREGTITLQKRAPLKLNTVSPNAKRIGRYETLEVKVKLDATYDNPFDPDQINVKTEFLSPSGKRIAVHGFFTQDFERVKGGAQEILRKVGEPYFAVRFTPAETGIYRYRIVVTGHDADGKVGLVSSGWFTLQVTPNPKAKGFVRKGKFWHLQFDNGSPFVPVGLNVCWSGNNLSVYEKWFKAMNENGTNFARIWLVRWNMGLEWTPGDGNGAYLGIGKYALDNAWRIDELVRIAERNGIYLMLCLGYHGELSDQPLYFGEQAWDKSPYNRKNGGPCDKPSEFWTNLETKRLYKQRLRYIVARYAHSPNVLAFEFWNEVHAPTDWVREMAQFIRSIDPYSHLLTTTYGDDAVWQLPEMDFAQTHWYGDGSQRDCVTTVVNIHRDQIDRYRKPFLLGEFGIDWRTSDLTYDPKGNALHWHNGVWASLMSGGAGTACIWYWDNYIDRLNLWCHFRPLADFVQMLGKAWSQNWQPLKYSEPMLDVQPEPPFGDLLFTPTLGWQRPTGDTFMLHRSGKVDSNGETSAFLFSPSKPEMYRPPKFIVDFPQDGQMALRINTVSSGTLLIVRVDGKEVLKQPLPEGEERKDEQGRVYRDGSYKERRWVEQWEKWDYIYDKEFTVPIPKGKHTVELDNQGADWCTVSYIRFTPYRDRRFAEVDIVGIQTDDMALLWVHNKESNFQNERENKPVTSVKGLRFSVLGLRDGRYRIVEWDTWKGGAIGEWKENCQQGRLVLKFPEFNRDFAVWVRRE